MKQVQAVARAGVDDETGGYFLDLEVDGKPLAGLVLGKDWSAVLDGALSFAFAQRMKADESSKVPDES